MFDKFSKKLEEAKAKVEQAAEEAKRKAEQQQANSSAKTEVKLTTKDKWIIGIIIFVLIGIIGSFFNKEDLCKKASYTYKDNAADFMARITMAGLGTSPDLDLEGYKKLKEAIKDNIKIKSVEQIKKVNDHRAICALTYELKTPHEGTKIITVRYQAIKEDDKVIPTGISVIESKTKR